MAVLSREIILNTALRLLDERGEHGAAMREIARELGVRPSALYNHVSGQDDVIAGIRELISDRIDVSGFGQMPWDDALEKWARSYCSAFTAHPPTIALLAVQPLAEASRTGRMYEAVCAGLIAAGWPEARVLRVIVSMESFILGSALDHVAPDDMLDPGDHTGTDAFNAAFHAGIDSLAADERPAHAAFEYGLRIMLAGLRADFAALAEAGDVSPGGP